MVSFLRRVFKPNEESFQWEAVYRDDGSVKEGPDTGWAAVRAGDVRCVELTRNGKLLWRWYVDDGYEAVFTRRRTAVYSMGGGEAKSVSSITIVGQRRPNDHSDAFYTFLWPDGRTETSHDFEAYQEE